MEYVAPILRAIVDLLWVSFAFTALFTLKPEIIRAFGRLTKAEILGQKIELRDELVELHASTVATEKEAQELPRSFIFEPEPAQLSIHGESPTVRVQEETFDDTIKSILQQATSDPKLALMALAAELEKQARQALATRGLLDGRRAVSLSEALNELNQYGFPPNLAGTLRLFSMCGAKSSTA